MRVLYGIFIILILFVIYLTYNAISFKSRQVQVEPVKEIEIGERAIRNLADAIRIKTISPENEVDFDSVEFNRFSEFLTITYPLTDSLLQKKVINTFSFLYKWVGSDTLLKPLIIMAHLDVVPADDEDLKGWKAGPFDAKILEDTLWGRGTMDDKVGVVGIMESVELLLHEKFVPKRTIYLAFGHDEEIGGLKGAAAIAEYLKGQGVIAEFILDEGGSIVQGMVPGIEEDVALIGVAEKGFVSIELFTDLEGGHSSMPNEETAIDVLAGAVARLRANPFPAMMTSPLEGFINDLGPEMPLINRIVFANKTVFKPLILNIYEGSAAGNALVRTTIAPTIFKSGIKDNVIPRTAKATLNFRILPGTSIEEVMQRVKATIDDDRIIITKNAFASEPSKSSSSTSVAYQILNKTILQVFPDVLTAPNIVIGATDSRHFEKISDNIFRFLPIYINEGNIKSFHGVNERIAVKDFHSAIRFYVQLIKNNN